MSQARRFAELLSEVARDVTRRQAADVCCGNLTLEQFQTLQALAAADRLSMGELSSELRVDASTMTRNVALMERNGYLARARSEQDGRFVHVGLTAKGRRALETLRCDEREILSDVFDRVPPADRPRIIKALEILQTCLDRREGAEPCCPPQLARRPLS